MHVPEEVCVCVRVCVNQRVYAEKLTCFPNIVLVTIRSILIDTKQETELYSTAAQELTACSFQF